MAPNATRELATLFGSETRAGTLGVLANADQPLSGYRIAKMAACQETKVNIVLADLLAQKIVGSVSIGGNRAGWVLEDPDLRRFFRRRVRISWSEDLLGERQRGRARALELSQRLAALKPVDLSGSGKFTPRNPAEFDRPPEKDLILKALGLRPSRRERAGQ